MHDRYITRFNLLMELCIGHVASEHNVFNPSNSLHLTPHITNRFDRQLLIDLFLIGSVGTASSEGKIKAWNSIQRRAEEGHVISQLDGVALCEWRADVRTKKMNRETFVPVEEGFQMLDGYVTCFNLLMELCIGHVAFEHDVFDPSDSSLHLPPPRLFQTETERP